MQIYKLFLEKNFILKKILNRQSLLKLNRDCPSIFLYMSDVIATSIITTMKQEITHPTHDLLLMQLHDYYMLLRVILHYMYTFYILYSYIINKKIKIKHFLHILKILLHFIFFLTSFFIFIFYVLYEIIGM